MTKSDDKIDPNPQLERAMAEALESVERAQAGGEAGPAVELEVPAGESQAAAQGPSAKEKELTDQLLRMAADFDNFRKRARREHEDARKFGAERLALDLLSVADNLERALQHAGADAGPVIDGVRMVHKQFIDALRQHGIEAFSSIGKGFDPELHEAVGQVPAGDMPPGSIVEELQRGFTIHGRLLRPARVLVATVAVESGDGEQAGSGESNRGSV